MFCFAKSIFLLPFVDTFLLKRCLFVDSVDFMYVLIINIKIHLDKTRSHFDSWGCDLENALNLF